MGRGGGEYQISSNVNQIKSKLGLYSIVGFQFDQVM